MGFSISGYVLEPPRVGGTNSPFTLTPASFTSDPSAYNAHYTSAEDVSRTDYLALVMVDGKLPAAVFGWTKNEGLLANGPAVQRFDYDSKNQRFFPLPGGPALQVGVLGSTSNTQRLKVPVPIGVTPAAPFRLSIGSFGSGLTQAVSLVTSFGSPPSGTTELLTEGSNAGQLNWNATDLVTFGGQTVRFQQQSPFPFAKSTGNLGIIGDNSLLLTPIPGDSQYPLIRLGFGLWLPVLQRADEAHFSVNPASGTVEWALSTGMLKFNSTDVTNYAGVNVYYDGVLMAGNLSLPLQSLGNVNPTGAQATTISGVPQPGGDLIFRVPGVVQFDQAVATPSAGFDLVGKQGQVQYDPGTGQVLLSLADRIAYAGRTLQVVFGDLLLERGLSLRFFRTPVDLGGVDPSVKDVSAIYSVTSATLQSPIVGIPQVFLPSTPVQSGLYPTTVRVTQGTGSFTGTLPNLELPSPPAGFGYVIDFDKGQLQYAQRNVDQLVLLEQPTQVALLPNPMVVDSQLSVALETAPGSGLYTPFTESLSGSGVFTSASGLGGLLDATAGQFAFTDIAGEPLAAGSQGAFAGGIFTDPSEDFGAGGASPGDILVVLSGTTKGTYTVASASGAHIAISEVVGTAEGNLEYQLVQGKEVLADRFFQLVELVDPKTKVERIRSIGPITNSPRLQIDPSLAGVTRVRFGTAVDGGFSQSVILVQDDSSFSTPAGMQVGTVEISIASGNLNFAQEDVSQGSVVYWVGQLRQGADYVLAPDFGTIRFTDRFLVFEEALITYSSASDPTTLMVEPVTFIVRKELTQSHPTPTSTVAFNPLGRTVAANPAPSVFRGGRPQVLGSQCTVNTVGSTVTFLSDTQLTDALPHGSTVQPSERIYIDYFIYQAMGGEQTVTILKPPMNVAQVSISADSTSFQVTGDQTAAFPAGYLLRIEREQIYTIASSSYDPSVGLTMVILGGGETFSDDYHNPKLYVTSGVIRIAGSPTLPSYFSTEPSTYAPVAKGMNLVKVTGDRTRTYKTGTILMFTDSGGSFQDFYETTGVSFDTVNGVTKVTLCRNTLRQYDTHILKYSLRPILEAASTVASTSWPPVPSQLTVVYRKVEGLPGRVLQSPGDYTMDPAGNVQLSIPLTVNEELSVLYTGYASVPAGLRLKTSYTNIIAPNSLNGLAGQTLLADYSTFRPDNFYFRVETMTNFRGEVATDLQKQATSSVPSGGPTTSNSSQPQLFEQGSKSLYFDEGHFANEDIIARSVLKLYNDSVNFLEDCLHAMDGRVVGDSDGRFVFDGVVGRTVTGFPPTGVLNQIDDLVQVSPFPLPSGTYQQIYLNGPFSRFFKTKRNVFATSPALSGNNDGDPVAKCTYANLSSVPGFAFKRWPRGQVQLSYPMGTTVLTVDNANGTTDALQRPSFANQMRVVIEDAAGLVYLPASANTTVASYTPTTITLSAPVPNPVPAGATIYVSPNDANSSLSDGDYPPASGSSGAYNMNYRFGKDLDVNLSTGELLYISRKFPYNGLLPTIIVPKSLDIYPLQSGDILQINGAGVNVTSMAPTRFSALDGATVNDDGDQAVPMVGPTFDGEAAGALATEAAVEASGSPFRTSTTTPTFTATGSLDVTRTVVTLGSGTFPSPVPVQHDLVRLLSGANGATAWRRIVSATTSSVTVAPVDAFATVDAGFTFALAVSSTSVIGTATLAGNNLHDAGASFSASVQVGWTVVMTSGPNASLRRQILAIPTGTDLTLSTSFTSATGGTYRVDNGLDTYSGSVLTGALAIASGSLTAENTALLNFVSAVTTLSLSGATASLTGTTLTDLSQHFFSSGVIAGDLVYVPTGVNAGFYIIASVDSDTQTTVQSPFPFSSSGTSYQMVSLFGISAKSLQSLFGVYLQNLAFTTSTTPFHSLLTTQVPVLLSGVADPGAFALGLLPSDLDARHAALSTRTTYVTTPGTGALATVQTPLSSSDRLYDKRYTWIDARINQKNGLLVQQQRAVANRIAAQTDVRNQLTKLLAVQVG